MVLTQSDRCPYEKGTFGDKPAHREDSMWKLKAEIRVALLQAKECQDCQQTIRSWERGLDQILLTATEGTNPADT